MADTEHVKTISELLAGLTLKERRFADAWLRNVGVGTLAVIQAGYDVKDENSAGSMAVKMLKKEHIAAYITRALYPEVTELRRCPGRC